MDVRWMLIAFSLDVRRILVRCELLVSSVAAGVTGDSVMPGGVTGDSVMSTTRSSSLVM